MAREGIEKPTATPEFGKTASAYAVHRLGFPVSMYDRWALLGLLPAGSGKALDMGTGTGTIARTLASMGHKVTATDIDAEMLETARSLASKQQLEINFLQRPSENTGLDGKQFDFITAGQCWHWFDRRAAALEAHRLLKPSGMMMICHFDWLPLPGNIVEGTEKLILNYNPDWKASGGTGIYPAWFGDLAGGEFTNIQSFSYDEGAPYSQEAWVGRIEASAGIAMLPAEKRAAFKLELAAYLKQTYGGAALMVPHRVFCVWGHKNQAAI
ncbi:class I SAM-dependent methyltransferase [Kordiimonas lipolytica]|uniref:Class I SAM-dependent methyltransferase n=1 Tax=Kordiimonas lipolytica TaxID=1662421 RepID=A0ABV8U9E3_9PROT|nr:class I SAM-dependent methyltransferase [Kordiimonas lipolytica]